MTSFFTVIRIIRLFQAAIRVIGVGSLSLLSELEQNYQSN